MGACTETPPEAHPADEASLVAAARSGQQSAFVTLVEIHHGGVRTLASGLLGDDRLAEQAVQETFLRAWRELPTLQSGRSGFAAWLYGLTRRVATDLRRSNRDIAVSTVGHSPRPRAEAALALLEQDEREAFLLVSALGLSYERAGRILGRSKGAVAFQVHSARLQLVSILADPQEEASR